MKGKLMREGPKKDPKWVKSGLRKDAGKYKHFELVYLTVTLQKWLEGAGCPTRPSPRTPGLRGPAPRCHSARSARVAAASRPSPPCPDPRQASVTMAAHSPRSCRASAASGTGAGEVPVVPMHHGGGEPSSPRADLADPMAWGWRAPGEACVQPEDAAAVVCMCRAGLRGVEAWGFTHALRAP